MGDSQEIVEMEEGCGRENNLALMQGERQIRRKK
jgi:hypothetical protein